MYGTLGPSVSSTSPLVSQPHVAAIGATLDTGMIASKYSVPARPRHRSRWPRDRRARLPQPRPPRLPGRGFTKGWIGEPSAWCPLHRGKERGSTSSRQITCHRLDTSEHQPPNAHPQITVSPSTGTTAKPPTTPARSANAPAPLDTQGSFRDGLESGRRCRGCNPPPNSLRRLQLQN